MRGSDVFKVGAQCVRTVAIAGIEAVQQSVVDERRIRLAILGDVQTEFLGEFDGAVPFRVVLPTDAVEERGDAGGANARLECAESELNWHPGARTRHDLA
ncbi:MAG: hypothetical protein EBV17_01330, partial [Actinobacteria bacterium]|nr:hypothetical protein [Actinomycetota bacterium]